MPEEPAQEFIKVLFDQINAMTARIIAATDNILFQ